MGSKEPKVVIIIVNWNGWSDTIECLHSLENLQYTNYSVIVVDNGSTDQSVETIKRKFKDVKLIESDENRGFAGGNNLGITYALDYQANYVWLLNNDTVVEENALSALVARMSRNSEIGICGSKLIYYHQRDTMQALAGGTYNKWMGITQNIGLNKEVHSSFDPKAVEEQLQYIVGASMLVSRTFIEQTGLLSEAYFLYYEELEWAMRAKGRFKLAFAPNSIVYHKEGASIGGSQLKPHHKSKKSDYYQLKNRLKFAFQYFPRYLPFVYLTLVFAIFNRMIRAQWSRIPMIIKLMFTFNK